MNHQSSRTVQEFATALSPAETLATAKRFFTRQNSIYAAFIEQESATHVSMRGQGGEELLIGVRPITGGTAVTGSTYLFDQQIARFLATLPPAPPAPDVPAEADEGAAPAATAGGPAA